MRGLLVRVGIDATAGGWNGPVNPQTGDFVYVPIPEAPAGLRPECRRLYQEVVPALRSFHIELPQPLRRGFMHLDPDFEHLTYGDCRPRGNPIWKLSAGDFVVFYAGLRSIRPPCGLVYALIGFYEVAEVIAAEAIPASRRHENAHTRRLDCQGDVVVRARVEHSGRLSKAIPIGEYRDRAYRVRRGVLQAWGDLSVRDGYIQRSGRLPEFKRPEMFRCWFEGQKIQLLQRNN